MKERLINILYTDFRVNKGNLKSLLCVISFRVVHGIVCKNRMIRLIGLPIRIAHKLIIEWCMGVEIAERATIGQGLKVYHGQGLVVHFNTKIGTNAVLRQNTTIGVKDGFSMAPKIGNNVNIGANCVLIGDIEIGDNVQIGAGSVVVHSFPSNCVIAGNPAKIIKYIECQ